MCSCQKQKSCKDFEGNSFFRSLSRVNSDYEKPAAPPSGNRDFCWVFLGVIVAWLKGPSQQGLEIWSWAIDMIMIHFCDVLCPASTVGLRALFFENTFKFPKKLGVRFFRVQVNLLDKQLDTSSG